MIEKRWLRGLRRAGASLIPDARRDTLRIGRRAERRAERLLRGHGLSTLARNYTRRTGEIDLVMLDGDVLAFVEVRYRSEGAWNSGLGSVDRGKRRRLTRTAERYLEEHPEHRYRGIRFDVVSASRGNYRIACEWIQDAFDAMDG
ncbi:MAG: YraN family protein [Gammaproteobacteria bacterium]|nr:YraN family protein [Gammaproteobacteria bacterium]